MSDARVRAVSALQKAIYYLDRELAPGAKVRAFDRASEVVAHLDEEQLVALVSADRITDLEGVGPSTGEVIVAAVRSEPSDYLERLDRRSRIPLGAGAELRAAIRGDCHMHSTWSDGGATVAEMAESARALGHEYVVMTDHSARLTIAHGLDEQRLEEQLDEIAGLNAELAPFRVLTGMEVDIFEDGSLDLSAELLDRLDLVVASVHSKFRLPPQEMTRRLVVAVANEHVDIVGHLTNRKVAGRGRPPSVFDAEIVFAACAELGTAVEINCRPERQDPPEDLIELAAEWDCRFAVNTDAHAPGQLEWQAYGCDRLAAAGVGADRVINALSADDLVAWAAS